MELAILDSYWLSRDGDTILASDWSRPAVQMQGGYSEIRKNTCGLRGSTLSQG